MLAYTLGIVLSGRRRGMEYARERLVVRPSGIHQREEAEQHVDIERAVGRLRLLPDRRPRSVVLMTIGQRSANDLPVPLAAW